MESLHILSHFRRAADNSLSALATPSVLPNRDKLVLLENLMAQEDIDDLLQTFAGSVSHQLPVCRMAYHFMARRIRLVDSVRRGHKHSFTLQDNRHHFLGQLDYELEDELDARQQRTLQQMHNLLSQPLRLFLRMEQMDQLTRIDHLTGIGNRASFDEAMARAIEQNQRQQHGLTLVLLDLDHFKAINDTHGHPVGDKVLKAFADVLLRSVRRTDQVFRLGGDEFVLLLQPADEEAARRVTTRIDYHLQQHDDLLPLQVATSTGHARWQSGMDSETLYRLADEALYASKRQRRG